MINQGSGTNGKDQYAMGSNKSSHQQIELKIPYEYKIPNISGVKTWKEWESEKRRRILESKKASAFSKRFERSYGKGALDIFKKIVENPENYLADAGRYFGFTREHARYVYKRIYGCSYAVLYKKKRAEKMTRRIECRIHKTKKFTYMTKIVERLESMGLSSRILDGPPLMIFSNGYKVVVKFSSKPVVVGKKKYYIFRNGKSIRDIADYCICLCRGQKDDVHFIIPVNIVPLSGVSIPQGAEPDNSKYAQFKEAWHQLVPHNPGSRQAAHVLNFNALSRMPKKHSSQ